MTHPADAPIPIASPRNPLIRKIVRLDRDPEARQEEGLYLLWGWKIVEEALRESGRVERLLVGSRLARQAAGRALLRRALRDSLPLSVAEEGILEEAVAGAGDQGVLALVRMRRASPAEMAGDRRDPLLLVADRIQDPGNLGTLVRLGEAVGIAGLVVVPGTVDPYHTRAARASAGSILRVPVGRVSGAEEFAAWCRSRRLRIAATLPDGGTPCQKADLRGGMALVVGNEGEGVSRAWIEAADLRLTVPLEETVQSLNVTLAAAMLLYELLRQRRSAGPGSG